MDETNWVPVFTGRGPVLDLLQQELEARGVTVVRHPYLELGGQFEVGIFATQNASVYTLCVPQEQLEARREEIEAAVQASAGRGEGDLDAQAEAEEDYDVRACTVCRRFFHDNYPLCPEHGGTLVPAVECFAEGQLDPDRVIVGHGYGAETLAQRLQAAGFDAQMVNPIGWKQHRAVDLPWSELTSRTKEAEEILRGTNQVETKA